MSYREVRAVVCMILSAIFRCQCATYCMNLLDETVEIYFLLISVVFNKQLNRDIAIMIGFSFLSQIGK